MESCLTVSAGKELWTVAELAQELEMSGQSVRNWLAAMGVEGENANAGQQGGGLRVYRVTPEQLSTFKQQQQQQLKVEKAVEKQEKNLFDLNDKIIAFTNGDKTVGTMVLDRVAACRDPKELMAATNAMISALANGWSGVISDNEKVVSDQASRIERLEEKVQEQAEEILDKALRLDERTDIMTCVTYMVKCGLCQDFTIEQKTRKAASVTSRLKKLGRIPLPNKLDCKFSGFKATAWHVDDLDYALEEGFFG